VTIIALLEMAKNKLISLAPAEGRDDIAIRAMKIVLPLHPATT